MPGDLRRIIPIGIDSTRPSAALYGRACRVHGFAFAETTGLAVAQLVLVNGSSATSGGQLPVNINASGSAREWFGESGITFDDGVFLSNVAGTWSGSVFISEREADVSAVMSFRGALDQGQ